MEKHDSSLPLPPPTTTRPSSRRQSKYLVPLLVILAILPNLSTIYSGINASAYLIKSSLTRPAPGFDTSLYDARYFDEYVECPAQPSAIYPKLAWNMTASEKRASIDKFSQAVQIPTESFDDNGEPKEDPRWAPFVDFQKWLQATFPLANEKAKVEYINTLGILATFEGSDQSLKPLLLMSHYDVVPAPASTFDRWTHPPFSGYNDGVYIWGRGASDDKTLIVAQWEAITHLLESGFQPRRTVILSHGFDEEEVFARRGQGKIAPFLEERYGKDGLLMVIDEGSGTTDDFYGAPFAIPAMGEKGYMDIKISVGTAGGHSSVPPEHSGIGIMSQIVTGLEDNPLPIKLTPASPLLTALKCASKYSPDFPKKYSALLKSPLTYSALAGLIASRSRMDRATLSTTTAVDVVGGGVKVNALPELVTSLVNFRIDFDESVKSTQDHVAGILEAVAKKNGLNFEAFTGSDEVDQLDGKYVKVELLGLPLEPAPRTPTSGGVWDLFAGTVKAVIPGPDGTERIVTPYVSTGNTDCKMYYNLTKHVYRFMGSPSESGSNAHTVDEKAKIENHYTIVQWIHAIVQNADAYQGEE
ncbi:carboxypeptidase s precursor [Naematelia encephala]|uniref:Carboxypeptidase s n=1 Tax=Naematelia encephala TaxID=71784 RepID=A0A1Y2B786_9TREE|nr:carboxypeptidase s precursor [Naematelia encephala]